MTGASRATNGVGAPSRSASTTGTATACCRATRSARAPRGRGPAIRTTRRTNTSSTTGLRSGFSRWTATATTASAEPSGITTTRGSCEPIATATTFLTRAEFLQPDFEDDRGDQFDYLDLNGNNRIEASEWHSSREAFNWLDRNRDGVLSRTEVAGADTEHERSVRQAGPEQRPGHCARTSGSGRARASIVWTATMTGGSAARNITRPDRSARPARPRR